MSDPVHGNEPIEGRPAGTGTPAAPRQNGLAVTALVTGIIALLLSWLPGINLLSIALGLVALITGSLGLRAANNEAAGGRGLAIAGLVTGGLGLLFAVLLLVGLVAFLNDPEVQEELQRIEQEVEQEQDS